MFLSPHGAPAPAGAAFTADHRAAHRTPHVKHGRRRGAAPPASRGVAPALWRGHPSLPGEAEGRRFEPLLGTVTKAPQDPVSGRVHGCDARRLPAIPRPHHDPVGAPPCAGPLGMRRSRHAEPFRLAGRGFLPPASDEESGMTAGRQPRGDAGTCRRATRSSRLGTPRAVRSGAAVGPAPPPDPGAQAQGLVQG